MNTRQYYDSLVQTRDHLDTMRNYIRKESHWLDEDVLDEISDELLGLSIEEAEYLFNDLIDACQSKIDIIDEEGGPEEVDRAMHEESKMDARKEEG